MMPTVWARDPEWCGFFVFVKKEPHRRRKSVTGWIHSLETMGLVDGPGVRTVVFLQGCGLRCVYCHNPDTWGAGGTPVESSELMERILRFRPYFERSGGGVTFSGGEPLMQDAFLCEMLRLCKEHGIHTCVDTAGVGPDARWKEILRNTDLVLYDVKHEDETMYAGITGRSMRETRAFVRAVRAGGTPMWVRHVVVPGLTDGEAHMKSLRDYVRTLPHVQRVELLPYHRLGAHKYAAMGRPYFLEGVDEMNAGRCRELERLYFSEWNDTTNGEEKTHDAL